MGQQSSRFLEKKILENTERLIECAISASLLSNEAKDKELRRGAELVIEITNSLGDLIEVTDEYLPEILNQIVSQKLPDNKVQETLGTFNQELERILLMGLTAQSQKIADDFEMDIPTDSIPLDLEVEDDEVGEVEDRIDNVQFQIEPMLDDGESESVSVSELANDEFEVADDSVSVELEINAESSEIENNTEPEAAFILVDPPQGVLLSDLLTHPEDFNRNEDSQNSQDRHQQHKQAENKATELVEMQEGYDLEHKPEYEQESEQESEPEVVAALAPMDKPINQASVKQLKGLDLSLRLIFPNAEILQNVNLDGVSFAFYLPGKQVAIDQKTNEEEYDMKEKFCRQEGIAYYVIDPESSTNPRRVERILNSRRSKVH